MNRDRLLAAPLIVVHPFYTPFPEPPRITPCAPQVAYGFTGSYTERLEQLVRAHTGPLLLFEEWDNTRSTVERLKGRVSAHPLWTIDTFPDCSEPWSFEWKDALDLLACFGDTFLFAGGYLNGSHLPAQRYEGCLGTAFTKCQEHGLGGYFVRECCF